ncbi:GNAT family N-acetyltransferase [Halopseudomonas salina]|uniref:GNAT family N-acetyltransferase n=1 Tax=Halopseudomonas salina TaxID=1323744 RepID=UPI001CC238C2|nr:GNAT family N-acetyltransferase [Halopseudomonas salina]
MADKFYRLHGSRMKTRPEHTVWAMRSDQLVACLCLQPMAHGQWLTSLFVDPRMRRQGLAGHLLENACASVTGPIWLFCQPGLEQLYRSHGFAHCPSLPESLASKLKRYQRSKDLVPMWLDN